MKGLNQFIGIYPVSKTLRFELKPIGKTFDWIKKNKILESDEQKSEDYPKVKLLIDEYHKVCINESLKGLCLDWNPLRLALQKFQKEKSKENKELLEKQQTAMRGHVAAALKGFHHYKELVKDTTPKKLIDDVLYNKYQSNALKSFNKFALYFEGFQKNRSNIYSAEPISSGVPYRLVHDNFPKFLANIEVFENIKTTYPEIIEQATTELKFYLSGITVEEIFNVEYYNKLLTQDGIDFFNQIIGGVVENKKHKCRGINEIVNSYNKEGFKSATNKKALTMIPLFRQILSDRESLSYIPQQIESENQLIEVIEQYYTHMTNFEYNGKTVNILNALYDLTSNIGEFNTNCIYISSKSLADISVKLFGKWNVVKENLYKHALDSYGDLSVEKNKKQVEAYMDKDAYSISEVSFDDKHDISMYFFEVKDFIDEVTVYWQNFRKKCDKQCKHNFINNVEGIGIVKNFLDAILKIQHRYSTLVVSTENDLDMDFYNKFLPLYAELENVFVVYGSVRNFLTKKPSDTKKFKLNFGVPSLGNGWDQNKEQANKTILLFKDGLSYLGIMNAKDMPVIKESDEELPSSYKKMVYKLLADPAKDFPHTFFSKKGIEIYNPSSYILEGREQGKYKKGKTFDKKFMIDFIDFYKDAVSRHPIWNKFNFVYSPTDSYKDIGAFFREVSKQAYKIRFTNISEQQINDYVEKGQLFLFQIYNKDYNKESHGRKNLHTLYWENLFSQENLRDLVLKLNGQAELFYRPESIKTPIIHKVGSKMLNRRDKSGMPIPEDIYRSLYLYYNRKKTEKELTADEKAYIGHVVVKDVSHEIVKDKRFTTPKFFFHVPITFNVNADGNEHINDQVMEYLKDNPDINIIGIDRGERHLIYLTLINQRGEILKQKTFNIVGNFNYHAKLEQRECERDNARKSWQSIGKIKDLKEGFLSAVIHEVAVMMVENNAIVVLEDLNFGFKRGRYKVERQVYQKFEKMLIDKLNYLSFKDRKVDEEGGILRGYQLAQKFKSFQRLGKQSGFLFYIPAAYTSKIDPVTGFVNLFKFNDITNTKDKKAFFMKMERIEVCKGNIEFEFDYRKFNTSQTDYQNVWTVNSSGKRIVRFKDENGHNHTTDYYPSEVIADAFSRKNIALKEGTNIKYLLEKIDDNSDNASFYETLFRSFQKIIQLRNSSSVTDEDYILSPVVKDSIQFCTSNEADKGRDANGNWISKLPVDADANGAYHIALKGLYLLLNPQKKRIENEKWFRFMVEKPYLK